MAPKSRSSLRPHSRSSSATKISTNLAFTQKEPSSKYSDKVKKIGHDTYTRPNNTSRIPSKDQIAPLNKRQPPPLSNRSKPTFTVTVGSSDDGDEDEWVSSESGVTTPNPMDGSGSEDELDYSASGSTPVERRQAIPHERGTSQSKKEESNGRLGGGEGTPIPRIDTLRPHAGFNSHTVDLTAEQQPQPSNGHHHQHQNRQPSGHSKQYSRTEERPSFSVAPQIATTPTTSNSRNGIHVPQTEKNIETTAKVSSSLDSRPVAQTSAKRRQASTRPPSMHSVVSKQEHKDHNVLRPHPLIRGHSFGQPTLAASRPTPLTTSNVSSATVSESPPPNFEPALYTKASASPTTISASPTSPYPPSLKSAAHPRRTSVSSTRSVATLPVSPSVLEPPKARGDRTRTLSALSQSSSSAALSSLTHLPTITRPPSPQMISFFPPVNTLHTVEDIHPLLPPPYLSNHLTILAYRTPLRESYDRIIKAKTGR